MKRTTRFVKECRCINCNIIHLLGQTFNGKRCCDSPNITIIGEREIVEYTKTIEEEQTEVASQIKQNSGNKGCIHWNGGITDD